jgi:formate/nitrite transporter FocA (FNT family)
MMLILCGARGVDRPDSRDGGTGVTEQAGEDSPHLDEQEQKQAANNSTVGPLVIHEIVRAQGEKELERPFSSLAVSGLAAGLSIGFSFVAQAYLQAGLPEAPWARLVDSFGYSLGFLIVILGQQQLFTETTLTALIPTLTRRSVAAVLGTLRVWGIVLVANLVGTIIFGVISAQHGIFSPDAYAAMGKLSALTMAHPFGQTAITAGSAGWLIGLMIWLLPGAGPARSIIVILLTYVVALCQFPHVIAGSVEAAFGVASGQASVSDYLLRFLAPTLLGNTIGGTALVALLNHGSIAGELDQPAGKEDA